MLETLHFRIMMKKHYYPRGENEGADRICCKYIAELCLCFYVHVYTKKTFFGCDAAYMTPLLQSGQHHMSRLMGKPTICIGESKDADQLRGNREVQFLFYLNPKFQASSSFLCLYRPVCVGPVRKPHCWFSHEVADIIIMI